MPEMHFKTTNEDFKDLNKRTAADKVLHGKAFGIVKNPKYDWYQRDSALLFYEFFDSQWY